MTHICIDSGTRAAKELGYQPILIEMPLRPVI